MFSGKIKYRLDLTTGTEGDLAEIEQHCSVYTFRYLRRVFFCFDEVYS